MGHDGSVDLEVSNFKVNFNGYQDVVTIKQGRSVLTVSQYRGALKFTVVFPEWKDYRERKKRTYSIQEE